MRYHILKFTASDPMIIERCVDLYKIEELKYPFVKETLDSLSRCIKLEFFEKPGTYYSSVFIPSIVEFIWTDSSLIEKQYEEDGQFFQYEDIHFANKVVYLLKDSVIIKIKEFHNDKLIRTKICNDCKIDNYVFFLMYSGCNKKYNKKYRMRF